MFRIPLYVIVACMVWVKLDFVWGTIAFWTLLGLMPASPNDYSSQFARVEKLLEKANEAKP